MTRAKVLIAFILTFLCLDIAAQNDATPFAKQTTKENRANEYRNLVDNIHSNLLLPLNDLTEENWQDAFAAMELLNYRTPFIDARLRTVMDSVEKRSTGFQRALLEMVYPLYRKLYRWQSKQIMQSYLPCAANTFYLITGKVNARIWL